jgi:hypothetical protein
MKQLGNNYQVVDCVKQEKWFECCVQRMDTRGIVARQKEARELGQKMVPELRVGQWAAAQDRENQNHTFPFLVCKLLDAGNRSCVWRQVTEREQINNCRYDPGDFVLACQWYDRDPADPEGRTFVPAEKGLLNSTELRMHGFKLSEVTISNSQQVDGSDSDSDSELEDDLPLGIVTNNDLLVQESLIVEMSVELEQNILSKCW